MVIYTRGKPNHSNSIYLPEITFVNGNSSKSTFYYLKFLIVLTHAPKWGAFFILKKILIDTSNTMIYTITVKRREISWLYVEIVNTKEN